MEVVMADEEAPAAAEASRTDNTGSASAAPEESQPLLSESAIRTYYATNANEFARSYIDRTRPCSYISPQSLGQDAGAAPFGEHILTIVPTDSSDSEDSGIESCAGETNTPLLERHLNESYADAVASVLTKVTPPKSEPIEQTESAAGSVRSKVSEVSNGSNACSSSNASSVGSIRLATDSKHPDSLIDGPLDWAEETQTDKLVGNDCFAGSANDISKMETMAKAKTNDIDVDVDVDRAVKEETFDTDQAAQDSKESNESVDLEVGKSAEDSEKDQVEDNTSRVLLEDAVEQPATELDDEPTEEPAKADQDLADSNLVENAVSMTDSTAASTSSKTKDTAPGLASNAQTCTAMSAFSSRPRSSTLNAQAKEFVPGRKLSSLFANAATSAVRRSASDESAARIDKSFLDTTREDHHHQQQTFEGFATSCRSRSRHHGSMSSSESDHSNLSERTAGSERSSAGDLQSAQPDDDDDEEAPGPRQQASAGATVKRRCRFWPSCSNRNCKYRHPSQTCSAYPNCTFGNNCIYIHPSDVQKINSVISRVHGDGSRRPKRKHNDIIRLNNLSGYVKN
ncbi:hypothetical protein FB639_002326 [Coemansia asiatica]|nr:hypothetical protein FB639_002326 [Coemansia asiatica]